MSKAFDTSLQQIKEVFELSEYRIDAHLQKLDETNNADPLRVAVLAGEISHEVGVDAIVVLQCLSLYVDNRSDLDKSGGNIYRIGDQRVKKAMTVQECARKNYDLVKNCAVVVFDEEFIKAEESAIKAGLPKNVRLNFQNLTAMIADKLFIKPYAAYHCLKEYVEKERSDLIIDKGRSGGLRKV